MFRRSKSKIYFPLIEIWENSSLDISSFCEQHSITTRVFYYWHKNYTDFKKISNAPFVALSVESTSVGSLSEHSIAAEEEPSKLPLVELQLTGGRRILFYHQPDIDYIKSLID